MASPSFALKAKALKPKPRQVELLLGNLHFSQLEKLERNMSLDAADVKGGGRLGFNPRESFPNLSPGSSGSHGTTHATRALKIDHLCSHRHRPESFLVLKLDCKT